MFRQLTDTGSGLSIRPPCLDLSTEAVFPLAFDAAEVETREAHRSDHLRAAWGHSSGETFCSVEPLLTGRSVGY